MVSEILSYKQTDTHSNRHPVSFTYSLQKEFNPVNLLYFNLFMLSKCKFIIDKTILTRIKLSFYLVDPQRDVKSKFFFPTTSVTCEKTRINLHNLTTTMET